MIKEGSLQVWQFWKPGAQQEPLKQLASHFSPRKTKESWIKCEYQPQPSLNSEPFLE